MNGINIVLSRKRVTVDALSLSLNQDTLTIGTHDVAINIVEFVTLDSSHIKQCSHLLAGFERILHNTATIVAELGVCLTIVKRLYVTHRLTTEQAAGNLFQVQFLSVHRHHCQQCQRHE